MRFIFNFPDIGEGLDEGTIAEWYVVKGQQIHSGDALVRMETDKVVTDIPSPKTGAIITIYGKTGETIHVGAPLVEIEIEGVFGKEAIEEAKKETIIEPIEEGSAGVVGTMEVAGNKAYLPASDEGLNKVVSEKEKPLQKALSTPVARAYAKELNIDINKVTGTGPNGRVTIADVKKHLESSPQDKKPVQSLAPVEATDLATYEPLSQIRKTIAKNMMLSAQNAVRMSVHEEVEISELIKVREEHKALFAEKKVKITYLPFILKATALALKTHRALNSQLDMENNRMIYLKHYNIGIAVDTPEGLVVPVIHDVDKLSIFELAQKISNLSEKARERKLTMDELKDGTFTITSYGSIGGIFAVPVINYPQSGILGVGRVLKTPIVKDDKVVIGNMLPLSLTVDHRIVDGGEVTRFLLQVIKYLEDPVSLLME
jgi:pyruvate dehydrogenase E2 component (dihydrolipoamide acetyltransferase)